MLFIPILLFATLFLYVQSIPKLHDSLAPKDERTKSVDDQIPFLHWMPSAVQYWRYKCECTGAGCWEAVAAEAVREWRTQIKGQEQYTYKNCCKCEHEEVSPGGKDVCIVCAWADRHRYQRDGTLVVFD